jgi:hypothetical protein
MQRWRQLLHGEVSMKDECRTIVKTNSLYFVVERPESRVSKSRCLVFDRRSLTSYLFYRVQQTEDGVDPLRCDMDQMYG